MNSSKAPFWRRWAKRLRYWKKSKSIERAEADYIAALREAYSPMKQELRIRRFIAYNFPGYHVHKNPKGEAA